MDASRKRTVAAALVVVAAFVAFGVARSCREDPAVTAYRAWLHAVIAAVPKAAPGDYARFTVIGARSPRQPTPEADEFTLGFHGRTWHFRRDAAAAFDTVTTPQRGMVSAQEFKLLVAEIEPVVDTRLPGAMRARCLVRRIESHDRGPMLGLDIVAMPNPAAADDADLPVLDTFYAQRVVVSEPSEMNDLARRHLLDLR